MSKSREYSLRIDEDLLRRQCVLLAEISDKLRHGQPYVARSTKDCELLDGIFEMLEVVLDQTPEQTADEEAEGVQDVDNHDRCDCESPGFFCSGAPGIIAHLENGQLSPGATVQRCDLCQRYPSNEAAFDRLRELGHVPPQP